MPFSQNKYTIALPETAKFSGKTRLKLHRTGIITGMMLNVRVKILNKAGDDDVVPSTGGLLNLFSKIALTQNNLEINTITKEYYLWWLSQQQYTKKLTNAIAARMNTDGDSTNKYENFVNQINIVDGGANSYDDLSEVTAVAANAVWSSAMIWLPFPMLNLSLIHI